jgi:Skp family chaperone for outer membrane proteins
MAGSVIAVGVVGVVGLEDWSLQPATTNPSSATNRDKEKDRDITPSILLVRRIWSKIMNFPLSKGFSGMRGLAVAAALSFVLSAGPTFAQAAGAAAPQAPAPRPAAPAGAPTPAAPAPAPAPFPDGARYAVINIQRIANESTEGKAATGRVNALVTRKQTEGADKTKQLQAAQQKMEAGGSVMSETARAALQKDIDRLTVEIQRFNEDAQNEVQALQNELMGDFQTKLAPVIERVAAEKKLEFIFSAADSGIVWIQPGLDITTDVIKAFDAAAPASAAAPAAPRPAAPAAATPRPAAPAAPRPAQPAAPQGNR